jgi:hypothetical protein
MKMSEYKQLEKYLQKRRLEEKRNIRKHGRN